MSKLSAATGEVVVKEDLSDVKPEPPDEAYLFFDDYVKEELNIEPTSVEPVDMYYIQQCKDEPAEEEELTEESQSLVDLIESPSRLLPDRYRFMRKQLETATLQSEPLRPALHCPTESTTDSDGQYFCSVCKTGWMSKVALTCHMRAHTPVNEKCGICKKTFRTKSGWEKHVNKHCAKNVCNYFLFCKLCNKVFSNHTIKLHTLSTHAKLKPFKCPLCEKSFALQCLLSRHLLCHNVTDLNYTTITKISPKTKMHYKHISNKDTNETRTKRKPAYCSPASAPPDNETKFYGLNLQQRCAIFKSNKDTNKTRTKQKPAYGPPVSAPPDNETKFYGLNLPQKCVICKKTFALNSNFLMHMEQHNHDSLLFT